MGVKWRDAGGRRRRGGLDIGTLGVFPPVNMVIANPTWYKKKA